MFIYKNLFKLIGWVFAMPSFNPGPYMYQVNALPLSYNPMHVVGFYYLHLQPDIDESVHVGPRIFLLSGLQNKQNADSHRTISTISLLLPCFLPI